MLCALPFRSGPQEVYMPAADSGALPLRVFAMVPLRSW
jgi:hypothetical protein